MHHGYLGVFHARVVPHNIAFDLLIRPFDERGFELGIAQAPFLLLDREYAADGYCGSFGHLSYFLGTPARHTKAYDAVYFYICE